MKGRESPKKKEKQLNKRKKQQQKQLTLVWSELAILSSKVAHYVKIDQAVLCRGSQWTSSTFYRVSR